MCLRDCFTMSRSALKSLNFSDKLIEAIQLFSWSHLDKALAFNEHTNQHLITWHDKTYPKLLKELASPPPMLFIKGDIDAISLKSLAIVGTRHPTQSAKTTCYDFTHALSKHQLCIVSGLAIGIDGIAHQAALDAQGTTIAVMACGIDTIYPKRHHKLHEKITEQGAVISEFPLGTEPERYYFPQRNRLISGLSQAVLVIEAKEKSGSLVTAYHAIDQNRDVFAIPSSIHNPLAKGCHQLIKQGALLVDSIDDILKELHVAPSNKRHINKKNHKKLDKQLQNLVKFVGYELTPVNTICTKTGLSIEFIAQGLIELELAGWIKAVPGGYLRLL